MQSSPQLQIRLDGLRTPSRYTARGSTARWCTRASSSHWFSTRPHGFRRKDAGGHVPRTAPAGPGTTCTGSRCRGPMQCPARSPTSSDRPRLALVKQVAAQQLPSNARLIREEIVPAVLRLPMRPMDGAGALTAMGACRCRPVFLSDGCVIDGQPIGLKACVTWDGTGPASYYTEAAIGVGARHLRRAPSLIPLSPRRTPRGFVRDRSSARGAHVQSAGRPRRRGCPRAC